MIKNRIDRLRSLMAERNIDTYIIPTADFHESEYVCAYFQARKYMCGFTGSAGVLVITRTEGCLFTDGRYFIQAERQLQDTSVDLYRSGEKGVPSLVNLVVDKTPENGCVAFDGRVINAKLGQEIEEKTAHKSIRIRFEEDLIDLIWEKRPPIHFSPIWHLEEKYTGKSVEEKLKELRSKMQEHGADVHVLTSLNDIAWLYNMRADDVPNNPVAMAYTVVYADKAAVFLHSGSLEKEMEQVLAEAGVAIFEYEDFYTYISEHRSEFEKVLIDPGNINYVTWKILETDTEPVLHSNPTIHMKSIKNQTEIKNITAAHIKDGAAVTKFMYWLKSNIGRMKITEMSATEELLRLRSGVEGFIDLSFDTIAAYKDHAPMMHYSATPETDAELMEEEMFLVDSGGHYYEGTTDITRTFVLGDITEEMKLHYTTVVKSMLRLSKATFLYGCTGLTLDVLAREPVWNLYLDYKCGTGHGVGYLLSVHEGPNQFRWKSAAGNGAGCVFEPGMITTNEPGIYIEGSHGIRIENEILCIEKFDDGQDKYLGFTPLTFVPIDLDGVDVRYLDVSDIAALNEYHKAVYETISPYLNAEEKKWLAYYTRPL
ncbi:aminopeptidase P family protein [Parasporobacterium paucivorans]|uniref:Xaa-Pro aminopeptidase n=1 Tax=Parasporobacterium paucivorans DSM 15970 TaxID=1122934 RepID=A0A1M6HNT6_9FIRM|nr:aminopeptidase P family protein [Parasporobacterium paucivorans]SHJ23786.1 Xaa-Pro aminopeptidase [Parasporobacterium paucivorans DSM 15970]